MDESWRMRMGMTATTKPNLPRRRSTEETSRRTVFCDSDTLGPEDFDDVFGGPPRSVLSRQFTGGEFTRSNLFYEEIFRQPENIGRGKIGRNLPEFRIPGITGGRGSDGFYSDIFGKEVDDLRRSRSRSKPNSKSKSKSNSSSVLSSEELSPFRPVITDDDLSFSSFTSKLRPINVSTKWNSSTMMHEGQPRQQGVPEFSCDLPSYVKNKLVEHGYVENFRSSHSGFSQRVSSPETVSLEPNSYNGVKVSMDDLELNSPSSVVSSLRQDQDVKASKIRNEVFLERGMEQEEDEVSSHFGFSQLVSSPETVSLEPNSYGGVKVSMDDLELNSPSSVVSSLCHDQEAKASKIQAEVLQEQGTEQEEDEVMSSYVIEINSGRREGSGEALAIDEAIAWAKEKFQTSSDKDWSTRQHEREDFAKLEERPNAHQFPDGQIGGCRSMQSPVDKKQNAQATEEENQQLIKDLQTELLDEDIRLWSAGKKSNIRLLLSTLHHILWPNSGWYSIPLSNLKESSHVKKAYQKARLCLHPDKLQQRGATLPQKYVAEKAFPILQDAWAAFISQDVYFS